MSIIPNIPIQQPQVQNMSLSDKIENPELKQFDDTFYPHYRENSTFIPKENLFQMLINDIFEYLKTCEPCNEIRIGYIIVSKLALSSSKLNNILNLLVQKINPNIRVQSVWDVQNTYRGPMQTDKGIENVDVDKIRIKVLIRPNDKDIAIKKLIEMNLSLIKKNNKKIGDYLINHK